MSFMKRRLRTSLDTIHPDKIRYKLTVKQITNNQQRKHRKLTTGQKLMNRNYSRGPKWLPGLVTCKSGPSSYRIETNDGTVVSRHTDDQNNITKL